VLKCKICKLRTHRFPDCPRFDPNYVPKNQPRTPQQGQAGAPQQQQQQQRHQSYQQKLPDKVFVVAVGEHDEGDHELVTHRICVIGDAMDEGERAFYAPVSLSWTTRPVSRS
jgi:hypothetical protein